MAQRKVLVIPGYGQSNEQGTGVSPAQGGVAIAPTVIAHNVRHQSIFGLPNVGSTSTSPSVATASMFQKVAEHLALETGWIVRYRNNCVGGQSCTDSWVGWDTTGNKMKQPGDSGYDPSGYLLGAFGAPIVGFLTHIQQAIADGFEIWTFTAGHQNDVNNSTHTVAEIIAASAHVQNRARALAVAANVPIKQFVGITPRYIGSAAEANWNPGGVYQQIRDGVLAAVPGALMGADLSANTDTRLSALDNQQYIHLNQAGICWAAEKWMAAIKAANAI